MSNSAVVTPPELYTTMQREATLANRVTEQLEKLIVDSHLQPGDRLPAERDLAERFGVSRTVVREAVRALVAKHLLEVKPGSGTIVRSPSSQTVAQTMTLFLRGGQTPLDYGKVLEVRRVLEVEVVRLAAQRRTAEDIERLAANLQEAAQIENDRDAWARNDVAFHAALARATHNELFSLLLDSLVDTMLRVRQLAFDVPGTPTRAHKYHRAIFAKVKAGDPEGAVKAMRAHLKEAEETQHKVLTLRANESKTQRHKAR